MRISIFYNETKIFISCRHKKKTLFGTFGALQFSLNYNEITILLKFLMKYYHNSVAESFCTEMIYCRKDGLRVVKSRGVTAQT